MDNRYDDPRYAETSLKVRLKEMREELKDDSQYQSNQ